MVGAPLQLVLLLCNVVMAVGYNGKGGHLGEEEREEGEGAGAPLSGGNISLLANFRLTPLQTLLASR